MNGRLSVLHLERNEADTELVEALFRREGLAADVVRVETRERFLATLDAGRFDVILADHSVPGLEGAEALELVLERGLRVPYIVFAGSQGEDLAIEILKRGAADYVLKHRPERLLPVLRRALRESEERIHNRALETALQSRERLFQALSQQSLDLVTILDREAVIRFQSPSSARVVGYRPDELGGREAFEFIHPDDVGRVREAFAQGLQHPELTITLDFRFRHADGSWRCLEAVGRNFLSDPDISGVVVNSRDITERKEAEDQLRRNEERFRRITENMTDLVAVLDVMGRRLYNSPSYTRLLGDPDQLKGTSSFEEIHPDDRERIKRVFRESVVSGIGQRAEYRFLRNDGTIRYIESQGSVVREPDGRVAHIIVVSRDITERKNAEERIREQAALLDKAQDAICVTDLDQRIVYWNKSAELLYGWTNTEVQGRHANELLFKTESAQAMEALKSLIARREWKGELRQVNRLGHDLIVESRWTLIHDAQGTPKSILVINTDITEKKKLETQFFRSQRLENIGMLASGIAHDLNNVLAPILMAVPMLREKVADPGVDRFLETLERSAQRGAELVGQILSFARGTESANKLLHLRHLITDIENIVRETFPKTIAFERHIARELWTIRGNTTQLHQVLLNLCVNARDAMPSGGTLRLTAENARITADHVQQHPHLKAGRCVLVTVADTGTGIPSDILAKIFEPFFTTKDPGKGTGLGLATVAGILKNHRGFVEVESEPGKGTRFRIHLPAAESASAGKSDETSSDLPPGRGELVLVVDDEVAIREIAKATLENYGYRVLTANSGVEALVLFRQHEHELQGVVLDSIMPLMDGPATLRALRELSPGVRIVAVSGLSSDDSEWKEAGAFQAFLSKPYTASQLLVALSKALKTG